MDTTNLPALNAALNATSGVLVLLGWRAIRAQRKREHRNFMVAALSVSVAFLVSYLTYHALHGSTKFTGTGAMRTVYFTILVSHTILAAITVPLVVTTVTMARRQRFDRHRKWARVTLPIWLYVSVTGVLIYFMLYQWFAPA